MEDAYPPPLAVLLAATSPSCGLVALAGPPHSSLPIDELSTQEGLAASRMSKVWMPSIERPGANLTPYDKPLVQPLYVEFSKNWKPEQDLRSVSDEPSPTATKSASELSRRSSPK